MKNTIFLLTLVLIAAMAVTTANAQEIHIPDVNLANAIRESLGLGEEAPITEAVMRRLPATLDASDRGIADLTGLEYATNLRDLSLYNTNVSDISPLANLTNLRDLSLYNTNVSDISPLANLTNLELLFLSNTDVSDISPLVNLTNLTRLRLIGCPLSQASYLTHIPTLLAKGIVVDFDLILNLNSTNVSDVSAIAKLTRLERLYLSDTNVSDISPLVNLTKLKSLSLNSTNVSDISALANLTNLSWLSLSDTNVSDISALARLTKLKTLGLRDTDVSDISALANLTNLEWLSLNSTNVSDISALARLTKLKTLGLYNTNVSDISALARLMNLEGLHLGDTNVSDISALARLTNLEWLHLYDTNVSDISALARLTNLRELNLSNTNVSDISALARLTNLEWLHLYKTNVSDISPLANLTKLKTLELRGCPLSQASYKHIAAMRQRGIEVYAPSNPMVIIDGLSIAPGKIIPDKGGNAFIHFEQYDKTCGPTSLLMVLHYYGKNATMEDLWDEGGIHTVIAGTTPSEMRQALNGLGVPAFYFNETSTDYNPFNYLRYYIRENHPPCILVRYPNAAWHWVVVVGYDTSDDTYLIADPNHSDGFYWLSYADLDEYWSNRMSEDSDDTGFSGWFQDFGANVVTNPYTMIVPKSGASESSFHEGLWTELQVHEQYGEIRATLGTTPVGALIEGFGKLIGKAEEFNLSTRDWQGLVTFDKPFDRYSVSTVKLNSFGGIAKLTDHTRVGNYRVNLWGRIEDGLAIRGRMWVFVRTFRNEKSPAAPSQVTLTRLPEPPAETSLLPNYPNPFNPETWIPYQLSKPAEVNVSIYSADGKLVRRLDLGQMPSGVYRSRARAAYWDGRNATGEPVASGIYFYTLQAGDFIATRKMVIRK